MKFGKLILLEPSGPVQTCTGFALPSLTVSFTPASRNIMHVFWALQQCSTCTVILAFHVCAYKYVNYAGMCLMCIMRSYVRTYICIMCMCLCVCIGKVCMRVCVYVRVCM